MASENLQVARQIARLRVLSREQLLKVWVKHYERPAPLGIRREVLIPFLAYKIQENAYGGLRVSTRSEFRRMARDLEKPSRGNSSVPRPRMKPGTRLIREWRGQVHEVSITESGFEYRGVAFKSLSEIARKVTGTRWSGPLFFGLKRGKSAHGNPDE
jgi:hypothetical protein